MKTNQELSVEVMRMTDRISACGQDAREELNKVCDERSVERQILISNLDPTKAEAFLVICREVLARWKTTNKFKVGDKVYVDPGKPTFAFENYIRATVTEVGNDKWGYHLRAFRQDLPGIYMFNIWDKDLSPRTDKSNKPLSKSHYVRN